MANIMGMGRKPRILPIGTFTIAAVQYWLSVWPAARGHIRCWRARVRSAPDHVIRAHVLETLAQKWTNVEGAVAFAVLTPPVRRARATSMLVTWQTIYDLADTLSEHTDSPRADSYQLHQALISAVESHPRRIDFYAHHPSRGDGGCLQAIVDAARHDWTMLPGYAGTAEHTIAAAERIACYQALHHGSRHGHGELAAWADTQTPSGTGLLWWETSAAASSSLPALAMIAAAADSGISAIQAATIYEAYWPWIGALHTLLDSLIDMQEDAAAGQRGLLDYADSTQTAARMTRLANAAVNRAARLPSGRQHTILLAGMTCLYLSAPEAHLPRAQSTTAAVLATVGAITRPAIAILRLRRAAAQLRHPAGRIAQTPRQYKPNSPRTGSLR